VSTWDAPRPANRVRCVFLGSGAFAVPILDSLATIDVVSLVGVVTAAARPAGRGGRLNPSPVAAFAEERGIAPILTPGRLRAAESVANIVALDPALLVLADYGQIVPPGLLDLPLHGALNLHPSLLPRHRGAVPVPAAILADDHETGVSLMRMDAGLDTGPVIVQVRVPLDGTETAPCLEKELARAAGQLLADTLPQWLAGALRALPQPHEGATLTRPLRREDGRVDPSRGASAIERQVRAFQPWPGTWLDTADGRLLVWRAHPLARPGEGPRTGRLALPAPADADVGSLVALEQGLALVVADGLLVLDEVQLAGGRRMPGADLVRGHRGVIERAVSAALRAPGKGVPGTE
jgi:methionyl-tRNA formyltransferase